MMTSRSRPSAADLTVALILSLTASGSGSSSSSLALRDSSSSSSSEMVHVHPRRYSILQVIFAMFHGAPAIPVLEDGHRAGAEESLSMALRERVRGVVVGTMNTYLRACGRIPMLCPDGSFDLNAAMAPRQLPGRGDPPVICAHCNRGFCFGVYEVPFLIPPQGYVYPERLPVPVTADLVTPPPVEPLYRRGPSGAVVLVCSNPHHFMVDMAMLRQPYDAPALVWRRPSSLGVLPSFAGSSRRAMAAAATPPGPSVSAGGNGNLVPPGHEDMVQLSKRRRHDPLALTLGRGFESHGGV